MQQNKHVKNAAKTRQNWYVKKVTKNGQNWHAEKKWQKQDKIGIEKTRQNAQFTIRTFLNAQCTVDHAGGTLCYTPFYITHFQMHMYGCKRDTYIRIDR